MSDPPVHLPPDHPHYQTIAQFTAYPQNLTEDIAALVRRLTVTKVTAIKYHCTARWNITPARRVVDDMFFYILAGAGDMDVDGRRQRFGAGDLIHWRRGVPHAATTVANDPIQVIAIHYTAILDSAITFPELVGFPDCFHLGPGHPLEQLAHDACREYAVRPPGWQPGIEALVVRLLLHLVRECGGALHSDLKGHNLRDIHRIMPAIEAMRTTIAMPLTIPALARRCSLSEAQFRRVFTRALGRSPVSHQRQLRLAEACRLLRETTDTIETIAGKVGYDEPAFFSNTFREAMGLPPGAYRDRREL